MGTSLIFIILLKNLGVRIMEFMEKFDHVLGVTMPKICFRVYEHWYGDGKKKQGFSQRATAPFKHL